jgi:hypothetical protein
MKKCLLLLSSASILLFSSCASKKEEGGGMSEKAKKNLATHQAVAKMFETKDFSKTSDHFAADAVDYAGMAPVKGVDSIKASLERMSGMMSDSKHETVKELADDEYVMAWMKFSGICNIDVPEMGMKKGQPISMEAIEVSQYNKDSKVIAHWTFTKASPPPPGMGEQTPPVDDKNKPVKDSTSK